MDLWYKTFGGIGLMQRTLSKNVTTEIIQTSEFVRKKIIKAI